MQGRRSLISLDQPELAFSPFPWSPFHFTGSPRRGQLKTIRTKQARAYLFESRANRQIAYMSSTKIEAVNRVLFGELAEGGTI